MKGHIGDVNTYFGKFKHGKKGIRLLVFAESFNRNLDEKNSVFVGVVVRGKYQVEDVRFSKVTLYGMDATETLIELFRSIDRPDINLILVNGVIVSLYNVIDLIELFEETGKPIIAVSYRESSGLEDLLRSLPLGEERLRVYRRNGERHKVILKNGFPLYIRTLGVSTKTALILLNQLTEYGKIPEPIKVAKSIARGIFMSLHGLFKC